MTTKFKVGDVVRVLRSSRFGSGMTLSKPLTIEKEHKNGNLMVGGVQWRAWGHRVGENESVKLVLDGSEECLKAQATVRLQALAAACRNAVEKSGGWEKLPVETLEAAWALLKGFHP